MGMKSPAVMWLMLLEVLGFGVLVNVEGMMEADFGSRPRLLLLQQLLLLLEMLEFPKMMG